MDLKKIYITIYKLENLFFYIVLMNELLMVEYDKQCLRYRWFLLFKKIEKKMLPSLLNQIYLFDLINIKNIIKQSY